MFSESLLGFKFVVEGIKRI